MVAKAKKPEVTPNVETYRDDDGITQVVEGDTTPTYMVHPDLPGPPSGPVPRWAFDALWSLKGWQAVDQPDEGETATEEVFPVDPEEESPVADDDGVEPAQAPEA